MSSQTFRPGGRPISLLKGTLGAAVALAALSLSPGSAQAYVVTVNSVQYDVTTFTGSYNDNVSKFGVALMPWWGGSSTLANAFAAAVGAGMGYPNGGNGPFFAWKQESGQVSTEYTYEGNGGSFPYGQYSASIPVGDTYPVWAQVAPAAAPVPAPLPLFGAAAAFGFSRKLRKRIQGSRLQVSSRQPRA